MIYKGNVIISSEDYFFIEINGFIRFFVIGKLVRIFLIMILYIGEIWMVSILISVVEFFY